MHFAKLNGVTLHYQVIGAPEDKPLLVFSNSLGTDFRIWRDVIFRLAGDYALLTYDKRGHGLSDLGETPYTMDDHIDDLDAETMEDAERSILGKLGIPDPYLEMET